MTVPAVPRGAAAGPLRVGISARLMHHPPPEFGFGGRVIQYLDPSIANWLMRHGALAFMVPTLEADGEVKRSRVSVAEYVREIDGLVLQGGADVSPLSYGEEPMRPEWSGDRVRDLYEIDLLWECVIQRKPVLGVCRGHQLINVAFGGTLYQDIATQLPEAVRHVDRGLYDRNTHEIEFVRGSELERMYGTGEGAVVNSIHHQAVKSPGQAVAVEARSRPDGLVEAIRWNGSGYVVGVQWHPELYLGHDARQIPAEPLLADFLAAIRAARAAR